MNSIRHSIAILLTLFACTWAFAGQIADAPAPASAITARASYVGDEACSNCHRQEFEAFRTTAHHLASRQPTDTSIQGSFAPGANVLRTANPFLYYIMNAGDDGYFQSAVVTFPPAETITRKERFGLVIGSGRKGQTYLYWKSNALFELPVSFWSETRQWMNSPGFPDGVPSFDKAVIPRCLECHTTFAGSPPLTLNRFDRAGMVLGITCERCHGPGAAHVDRTQAKAALLPGQPPDIVNPATLSRDRQMDVCALCHAGPGTPRASAFSFTAGAELSQYLTLQDAAPDAPSDVHAHQVQQLRNSRCYLSSAMTCSTCHNVHIPQRDTAAFAERCLTCHKVERCGKFATLGLRIVHECVNCHMPLKQSNQIAMDTQTGQVNPQVRTHRIAIYKEIETQVR